MPGTIPIFYSALLLTGVNLLLRFVGTSFQVYLSATLGAGGVGLVQLVMSVGSLAMVAGMGGIRTAAMYLSAAALGKRKPGSVVWVLSGCFRYSICCSGAVSLLLMATAPWIAEHWIGNPETEQALRLFAAFLPVSCLCGVMTGYFTAAGRIGTLAAVEAAEQLSVMAVTVFALSIPGNLQPARACMCVILGSGAGACLTLFCLSLLRWLHAPAPSRKTPVMGSLLRTAVPLAAADVVKSGINTLENLMVPRRLAANPAVAQPLAAFGTVSGMVFPVMMFPACILYGLAELLIPELSRCAASGSKTRVRYLVRRTLKAAMLYGLLLSGLLFLLAEPLCLGLYGASDAGQSLKWYALLVPMLYCDAVTDAMTKGLGQQSACVRYNIVTSALDVMFLYVLLPHWGMKGYYVSFLVTHLLNFVLSLRRLLLIANEKIPWYLPLQAVTVAAGGIFLADFLPGSAGRAITYPLLLGSGLCLAGITGREDLAWIKGLVQTKK